MTNADKRAKKRPHSCGSKKAASLLRHWPWLTGIGLCRGPMNGLYRKERVGKDEALHLGSYFCCWVACHGSLSEKKGEKIEPGVLLFGVLCLLFAHKGHG